jgi:hypothetical protein
MKARFLFLAVLALISTTLACQLGSEATPTPYPTHTPLPTYTPQGEPQTQAEADQISPTPYPTYTPLPTYTPPVESQPEAEGGQLPFVGIWESEVGVSLEISEEFLIKKFYFGGDREIHYKILDYDLQEGHMDLFVDKVIQDGEEMGYDKDPEQYLSYTINDGVFQMFIGPNPYPNASAGISFTRQQ